VSIRQPAGLFVKYMGIPWLTFSRTAHPGLAQGERFAICSSTRRIKHCGDTHGITYARHGDGVDRAVLPCRVEGKPYSAVEGGTWVDIEYCVTLCTAVLDGVYHTTEPYSTKYTRRMIWEFPTGEVAHAIINDVGQHVIVELLDTTQPRLAQHIDWTPGRLAYRLRDIQPCPPISVKGSSGSWPLPREVDDQLLAVTA
jgi:hypothetical protein